MYVTASFVRGMSSARVRYVHFRAAPCRSSCFKSQCTGKHILRMCIASHLEGRCVQHMLYGISKHSAIHCGQLAGLGCHTKAMVLCLYAH